MDISLDATYSVGRDLSGVGVYSRELLHSLADLRPDVSWKWRYRAHRYLVSQSCVLPGNVSRGLLLDRSPWRFPALFHGLNQRLPRTRFKYQVATFHDLFVMTADYSTSEFRARFTEQARHAAAEADQIIAVSRFTATQVIDLLGVDASRVSIVPHGVRVIDLPEISREPIILHVGAIQKRKNLVRLVRAFEAVAGEWRLVLAGSNGYGSEAIHEAIAKSTARDRITVTGYLGDEELAAWYARSMIFAFPSLDEGFGMPVLEAMSCGIPVLASNTSAVGEVAGEAALPVDPLDQDQIAEGLKRLSSDRNLREKLIQAGAKHASTYTWPRAAAGSLAVYQRLIRLP